MVADYAKDFLLGNHAGETIRAEEVEIAGLTGDLVSVRRDLESAAECAGNDVTEGMFLRFFRCEHAGLDLLEDPGMIVGEAVKREPSERGGSREERQCE